MQMQSLVSRSGSRRSASWAVQLGFALLSLLSSGLLSAASRSFLGEHDAWAKALAICILEGQHDAAFLS